MYVLMLAQHARTWCRMQVRRNTHARHLTQQKLLTLLHISTSSSSSCVRFWCCLSWMFCSSIYTGCNRVITDTLKDVRTNRWFELRTVWVNSASFNSWCWLRSRRFLPISVQSISFPVHDAEQGNYRQPFEWYFPSPPATCAIPPPSAKMRSGPSSLLLWWYCGYTSLSVGAREATQRRRQEKEILWTFFFESFFVVCVSSVTNEQGGRRTNTNSSRIELTRTHQSAVSTRPHSNGWKG